MERDLYLPGHPGKATADFFSSIDLPQDQLIYLHSLDNSHIFSAFDEEGMVVTFAAEYKSGSHQDTAASRQLSLYLCSGQHQRQALGLRTDLYGATIIDTMLRIYVSRWEEDNTVVCTRPLSTSISANTNKGVYPTPYRFSLATFPDFLRCYLFLCHIADLAAADATEVFNSWGSPNGQDAFRVMARAASSNPWRPSKPASSTPSHKTLCFADDPLQDNLQPEDWKSSEEDTEDDVLMVTSIEDEDGSKLLTRANLRAISSGGMAKDVQSWAQSQNLFDNAAM